MIFVTGGAGFIGSNFVVEWLAQQRGPVLVIDSLTYAGNLANLATVRDDPGFIFERLDICDTRALHELLQRYQPRALVHLAAESHVDRSILGPDEFVRTNIGGTFSLLEASRAYWAQGARSDNFRFLHISTDEVYGSLDPEASAVVEGAPYAPNSPYAASKAAADHLVRAYHRTYGLPTLTTHCGNNYGPYQFPEKLIPLLILNAVEGRSLPVYGDGEHVRDWLYVGDHCAAVRAVLDRGQPGEVYNIGGNGELSNNHVAQQVCAVLDEMRPRKAGSYAEQIVYVQDRPGHDRRYAINSDKVRRELGWTPRESFDTGLRKTIEWYLNEGAWVTSVRSGAYREWISRQYGDDCKAAER